ncbi:hypothetical protein [Acuticoccus sp. I52.16.1]|uniref:hypothetical protein n=1 Tax=Acuticoccus sp. I52.16.1 TaxID=2928472 RepID=UPI001FD17BA3|nr:hypothetical protein [Acuticoccus sp. I52.16.1]UOM34677.1 hypothetical protein MRB58_00215 [Acuticoccus sp. I52.16.1]
MHRGHDEPYDPYVARPHGGSHHAHNHRGTTQWQTPHRADGGDAEAPVTREADLDLVETAFVEGFQHTADPTSFLRLAGVPFVGRRADGGEMRLLRVALGTRADMASLTPHLGGGSFRYDPLPAAMVSKRTTLGFVYFDGHDTLELSFEEARALAPA